MSKTPQGKARSRQNAFKHGLRATDELFLARLKPAEREAFDRFRTTLHSDYRPQTHQEKLLVDHIAIQHFRLFRLYNLESAAADCSRRHLLSRESIIPHLDRFARYDANISRQLRIFHNRLRSLYISRGNYSLNPFNAKD